MYVEKNEKNWDVSAKMKRTRRNVTITSKGLKGFSN